MKLKQLWPLRHVGFTIVTVYSVYLVRVHVCILLQVNLLSLGYVGKGSSSVALFD